MELYLAIGNVVGLQRFVHHIPSRVVLNMLLQYRVPVYQEPVGTFRVQSDSIGNVVACRQAEYTCAQIH